LLSLEIPLMMSSVVVSSLPSIKADLNPQLAHEARKSFFLAPFPSALGLKLGPGLTFCAAGPLGEPPAERLPTMLSAAT
jgi:hypothetical protein